MKKTVFILFFAFFVAGVFSCVSTVAEENKNDVLVYGQKNSLSPDWLKESYASSAVEKSFLPSYFLSVILVLALLGASLFLFKKISSKVTDNKGTNIRVLHRYYLSPKAFLCLVEVENKRLLLGVGDSVINLLLPLDSNEFSEIMEEETKQALNVSAHNREYERYLYEVSTQLAELKKAIRKRVEK